MTLRKPKPKDDAYINNPMHTSNASRYFTKITRGKITHTFATCKSPTIFCEAFFIIITVILKFLLSPKSTAFARKTLSFCVCWLLMEKHFTSVGWRSVCFQVKKPFLLLKTSPLPPPSITYSNFPCSGTTLSGTFTIINPYYAWHKYCQPQTYFTKNLLAMSC